MAVKVDERAIAVGGARVSAATAGIRRRRPDLALIELAEGATTAAVFTRNRFVAAPVEVARAHLATQAPRYLLMNSGCANAGLGDDGVRAAQACCESLGEITGVAAAAVLPFSTGVIGEALPLEKVKKRLPELVGGLADERWRDAAAAIMTTDTRPKLASTIVEGGDGLEGACRVMGIAKGSGMIAPNMATMLAFVVTDAVIPGERAQTMLRAAAERSFNCIAVDGDTSTNDACTLSATGASGLTLERVGEAQFCDALDAVMQSLARAIVRDGEGATRVVTIRVEGAGSDADAREIARVVALSPLVKTAVYACDPNWGRIIAALGRAPAAFDFGALRCWIGDELVFADGRVAETYGEEKAAAQMQSPEWDLRIVVGSGSGAATFTTCDFSVDYVKINAEYRS